MEIGSLEVAVKPNREPDLVRNGSAFWWPEMVFMHVYGGVFHIKVDQEDGSLYFINYDERRKLGPTAKAEYDKWWYETFESRVLGDE